MLGRLSFEFTQSAAGKSHAEMIENLLEFVTPDPETTLDLGVYADLFYCQDKSVTLVGTWVLMQERGGNFETMWYAGGWTGRPVPSKEKALRYIQQHDRPA